MLDDIKELRTFIRIATAGSLSAASRDMGLALSVVSKRLATLERKTDTRLITRNTRQLSLTDEGARLFERAQRIIAEVDEAETSLTHGRVEPQGSLRVSAPVALGRAHVSPVCMELVAKYPKLPVDLSLSDRLVGLIDENIDVVVRIGAPQDSMLVVRKLANSHRIIVASPAYLKLNGVPRSPADLSAHQCLHHGSVRTAWHLLGPNNQTVDISVESRLRSDNGEVSMDWALAGCGLILKSWIDVQQDVVKGALVHVLPTWRSDDAPICALFPSNRMIPTRVRMFLDSMIERLSAFNTP